MDKKFDVLPQHIAIIMDGNGRWAKKRGLERSEGHKEGAKVFKKITEYAAKIGIKYITFYAFSTENWKRSQTEVGNLMNIFRAYLDEMQEREEENETSGYNIRFIGQKEGLPEDIVNMINIVERDSSDKDRIHVNIAINYGGRAEIVKAVKEIAADVKEGKISESDIDEALVSQHIYTCGQPDPDLIIRPSGEYRLSNFLIWQAAYSEFYYDDILWPDYTSNDLDKAIEAFSNRNRRFGA